MRAVQRLIDRAADAQTAVAALVLIAIMVHVVADVFGKYAFNTPVAGTLEIVAAYDMVAIVFLSFAYIESRHGHIRVEIFTRLLSDAANRRLDLFNYLVFTLAMALFAWLSLEEAITRTRNNELWQTADGVIAVWPSRWLLPLGMATLAFCAAAKAVRLWRAGARADGA